MQAAIEAQSPMDLSQGLAAGGQQSSIGSEADISVISCDLNLNAAAPAAGSEATDKAIRSANMVRAKVISEWRQYPAIAPKVKLRIRDEPISKARARSLFMAKLQ
jgi:hypothetical protein